MRFKRKSTAAQRLQAMPHKPGHTCAAPGCPAIVEAGSGSCCPAHKGATRKTRPSAAAQGYGRKWATVSRYYLAHHRICVDPYNRHPNVVTPSAHTDHIVPKSQGGKDTWENFQALCASCHTYKTMKYDRPGSAASSSGNG